MAASSGANAATRLFVDLLGKPMVFFMTPCKSRSLIRPIIEVSFCCQGCGGLFWSLSVSDACSASAASFAPTPQPSGLTRWNIYSVMYFLGLISRRGFSIGSLTCCRFCAGTFAVYAHTAARSLGHPEAKIDGEYHFNFILDCERSGKLLDINRYACVVHCE